MALALRGVEPSTAALAVRNPGGLEVSGARLSTAAEPSFDPKIPERRHSVVVGQRLRQLARSPVTMLTTPPGRSDVSKT